MEIYIKEPPNFEDIKRAFPEAVASRGVIFAYGFDIYNPFGLTVRPENIVHEQVHGIQMEAIGVEEWWKRYIKDPAFRAAMEIPAYRAEYRHIKEHTNDRESIARASRHMANALSGPNYGRCMTFNDAFLAIVSPRL